MYRISKLLSLISTGFLAAVFTYACFAIIPAWNAVPLPVHFAYRVALMRQNAIVMQSFMAVGILGPLLWARTICALPVARGCAIAASLMNLTAVLVTRFGNVPINQYIRKWLTEPPPADYMVVLHRWIARARRVLFGEVFADGRKPTSRRDVGHPVVLVWMSLFQGGNW